MIVFQYFWLYLTPIRRSSLSVLKIDDGWHIVIVVNRFSSLYVFDRVV